MGLLNGLSNAFSAAGYGAADFFGKAGLEEMRQQLEQDKIRLADQLAGARQERAFEHADKTLGKTQEFTRSMETDVRQPFARGEREATQGFQERMETDVRQPFQAERQERGFAHAERMQETSIEAAAKEHALNRQVTREGQGIQRQQVDILAKGAELDREIKQIQIDNARTLEGLKSRLLETSDPKEKAALTDQIHVLTGKDKDKFLPVPLKDELGNVTGYKIFDTVRGQFADDKQGGAPYPDGTELKGKDGKIYVVQGGQPVLKSAATKPSKNAAPSKPTGIINSPIPGMGPVPGGFVDRLRNRGLGIPLEDDENELIPN